MAPRPNVIAKNCNFLKLLKTMIVGALWFRPGLLCIRILLFLKNDGVMALTRGAKIRTAHKCNNDVNLPITAPNLNIFQ